MILTEKVTRIVTKSAKIGLKSPSETTKTGQCSWPNDPKLGISDSNSTGKNDSNGVLYKLEKKNDSNGSGKDDSNGVICESEYFASDLFNFKLATKALETENDSNGEKSNDSSNVKLFPLISDSNEGKSKSNLIQIGIDIEENDSNGEKGTISPKLSPKSDSNGDITSIESIAKENDSKGDKVIISPKLSPKSDSNEGNKLSRVSHNGDKDSPGLKALRLKKNYSGIRSKLEAYEKTKVARSKVLISPNKIRRKDLSDKIRTKMVNLDKIITKNDDKSKDKSDKMTDNMEFKKLKLIKNSIEENVKLGGLDEAKTIKTEAEIDATKMGEAMNAFDLLLKRSKGDLKTPKKSAKKQRKRIGLIETSSPDIRKWFGNGRESLHS